MPVVPSPGSVIAARPGSRVSYLGRPSVVVLVEDFNRVILRDEVTGVEQAASPHDLRPIAKTPRSETATQQISSEELKRGIKLETVLRPYAYTRLSTAKREELQRKTSLKKSQLYAALARLRESPGPVIRDKRGWRKGKTRLRPEVEKLIARSIRQAARKPGARTTRSIFEDVEMACVKAGLPPPSLKAVRARIATLRRDLILRRRHGKQRAKESTYALAGTLTSEGPLAIVEIDHSPLDIILVSSRDRLPMGRAYLTVVVDTFTRAILGFNLGLTPPSALSVALALIHAVLPKEKWLVDHELFDAKWPMYGIPKVLRLDGAAEFKSPKFKEACAAWGIDAVHRKRKEHGAIVERTIGKIQARAELEPGATGSDPKKRRKEQDPAVDAQMTIGEAERWLARQITERFHLQRIGKDRPSPNSAWQAAFSASGSLQLPALVTDAKAFFVSFLPCEHLVVNHDGLNLFREKYFCSELRPHVMPGVKRKVHYDPNLMGRAYVEVAVGSYVTVPYADATKARRPLCEIQDERAREKRDHPDQFTREARVRHNIAVQADRNRSRRNTRAARQAEQVWQAEQKAKASPTYEPPQPRPDQAAVDYSRPPQIKSGGVV